MHITAARSGEVIVLKKARIGKKRVWDGRGDRLADARKTEFAGRAADDLRLTGLHLRVLAHVGRQNANRGWLRLSQKELSERWGCSRTRLNLVIRELREWGYIGHVEQQRSHEALCFYQALLDEPFENTQRGAGVGGTCLAGETPPPGDVSRSGDTCVSSQETRVSRPGDTPVYRARAHRLTPTNAEEENPLNPPSADRARGKQKDLSAGADKPTSGADELLEQMANDGVASVIIERLFRPLLTRRKFSDSDKLRSLVALGNRCKDLEHEALDAVAKRLLGAGPMTIKAARIAAAIDNAVLVGAGVIVKPSDGARWFRWLEYLDGTDPKAAAFARSHKVYQSRTTWPPRKMPISEEAA